MIGVVYKDSTYKGFEAGKNFKRKTVRSFECSLSETDIYYKINSILIPGINEEDIIEVAKLGSKYKAIAHNITPLIPLKGTIFENISNVKPSKA